MSFLQCSSSLVGIIISGSQDFTAGNDLTLTCITDIDVSRSTVEWIWHRGSYNGTLFSSGSGSGTLLPSLDSWSETLVTTFGSGSAVLELHPVTVSMHGMILTCKATGTYGIQERSIAVTIDGKFCVNPLIVT